MTITEAMNSLPLEKWGIRNVIVLDWYDGPRKGIASMATPECEFYFELLAERPDPNDLDDRLFRLWEVPSGSTDAILNALRNLGGPANKVWSPLWKFEKDEDRARCEKQLSHIEARRRKTEVVIRTRDMEHFLGRFTVPPDAKERDWFEALGLTDGHS